MSVTEKIERDSLAISVAGALASANEAVLAVGIDPHAALITISQEELAAQPRWRIHYGPRDYINRRGGDITVFVDKVDGKVANILRGQ